MGRTFCAHRLHTPAHAFCLSAASASTSRTARLMLRCALNASRFWCFCPFFTGSDMANVRANGSGAEGRRRRQAARNFVLLEISLSGLSEEPKTRSWCRVADPHSLSGARARCLPRRGRSRGGGCSLCSRPRATRARLAVPHPSASRRTRASRAPRPRPRSAPPRRGVFRPRATRTRSGSRASALASRVPGTGLTATTERTRVCSCATS